MPSTGQQMIARHRLILDGIDVLATFLAFGAVVLSSQKKRMPMFTIKEANDTLPGAPKPKAATA